MNVFFHKAPKEKPNSENKKKELLDLIEEQERDNRQLDLKYVVDLTDGQKRSYLRYKETLEIENYLAPSRHKDSRPVNASELKVAQKYVRDVASVFLDEDALIEPNHAYQSSEHPLPLIKSSLLNTKQSNNRDIAVQKKERPKDLITVNTPVLERPLQNLAQKPNNL